MKHFKQFQEFLAESSGDLFHPEKGEWIEIKDPRDYPELSKEFFNLINTAYKEIGGHAKIKTPTDVFADPEWTFWKGVDIHGSPDLDLIVMGKDTRYGIKYTGVGHDGEKDTKKAYLDSRGEDLKTLGYYAEVSGKLASILIGKYKVPSVNNQKDVETLVGKKVEWIGKSEDPAMPGEGWYKRTIAGEMHDKIMLGKPRI